MVPQLKSFMITSLRNIMYPFFRSCVVHSSAKTSFVEHVGFNSFVGYYDHDPINSKNQLLFHRVPSYLSNDIESNHRKKAT